MKKLLLPLLVLSLFALTSTPAQTAPPNSVTYTFTTMDTEGGRSNATGTVVLQPLPNGKTLVRIQARGLQSGGEYFLTWSTGTSCALETDNAAKTFEHFKAHPNGNLNVTARLETDLTSIGSLGIRTETGQVLVACAASTP